MRTLSPFHSSIFLIKFWNKFTDRYGYKCRYDCPLRFSSANCLKRSESRNILVLLEWRSGKTHADNTATSGDRPAPFFLFLFQVEFLIKEALGKHFFRGGHIVCCSTATLFEAIDIVRQLDDLFFVSLAFCIFLSFSYWLVKLGISKGPSIWIDYPISFILFPIFYS